MICCHIKRTHAEMHESRARLAHGHRDTEHPLLSVQCTHTLLSKPTVQSTKAGQTFSSKHFLTFSSAAKVQAILGLQGAARAVFSLGGNLDN